MRQLVVTLSVVACVAALVAGAPAPDNRGPIVYCLEAVDNGGTTSTATLPLDASLTHTFKADLLGGIDVIAGPSVTAIPYYAWANRGRGEMSVWIGY